MGRGPSRLLLLRLLLARLAPGLLVLLRLLFLALRGPLLRSLFFLNGVRAVFLRLALLVRFSSQRIFAWLPGPRYLRKTRTGSAWRRKLVTGLVLFALTSSPGSVTGSGNAIGSGSIGTSRLSLCAHGVLSSATGRARSTSTSWSVPTLSLFFLDLMPASCAGGCGSTIVFVCSISGSFGFTKRVW